MKIQNTITRLKLNLRFIIILRLKECDYGFACVSVGIMDVPKIVRASGRRRRPAQERRSTMEEQKGAHQKRRPKARSKAHINDRGPNCMKPET